MNIPQPDPMPQLSWRNGTTAFQDLLTDDKHPWGFENEQ